MPAESLVPPLRLAHSYRAFRFGAIDPTARLDPSGLTMTTTTPTGPAWLRADTSGELTIGGPGADAVARRSPDPAGLRDGFRALIPAHAAVERLQRDFADVRIGSSGDVYKAALTATLGQRITAAEAVRQWARLCHAFGSAIDTPVGALISPPHPERLANLVPFQLHCHGIEESRARTLIGIARVFVRSGPHLDDPALALQRILSDTPRFGPWSRALVEAEALGNPDAVPIGDFHLKNLVAHVLTGRPRGTDEEMLATLAPYAGQRGRILLWLSLAGVAAPKFGPRRHNPDIRRL